MEGLASTIGRRGRQGRGTILKNTRARRSAAVDGFVSTGPVTSTASSSRPGPGASIVVYTQVNKIVSSNAALAVGGIALEQRPAFSLDTTAGEGRRDPARSIPARAGPMTDLGVLPMAGDLGVTPLPGDRPARRAPKISTNIKLPSFCNFGGGPAYARVTLRSTPTASSCSRTCTSGCPT